MKVSDALISVEGFSQWPCCVVICGSAVVMALQTVVSRLTDPLRSAVLSVTIFKAGGEASNVVG